MPDEISSDDDYVYVDSQSIGRREMCNFMHPTFRDKEGIYISSTPIEEAVVIKITREDGEYFLEPNYDISKEFILNLEISNIGTLPKSKIKYINLYLEGRECIVLFYFYPDSNPTSKEIKDHLMLCKKLKNRYVRTLF